MVLYFPSITDIATSPKKMSQVRTTFTSAAWNHTGKLLEYLFAYLSSVLIARGLGLAENGVFAGLISFSQLISALTSLGLETSLNKHIPQLSKSHSEEQVRYLLRRLIFLRLALFSGVAGLVLLAEKLIYLQFLSNISEYLVLLVIFTGCRSIVPLFAMALVAQLRTELNTWITLAVRFVELLTVGALFAAGGMSVSNLIIMFLTTTAFHLLVFVFFTGSQVIGAEYPLPMRPVLMFGGIFWLNTISEFILGRQGDVLFLYGLASDPAQTSLYDVAYSVVQLAALGTTVGLGGVTFAAFASLAVDRGEVMNRFYNFLIRIVSLLTIPLFAFLLWNGRGILHLLYSEKFDAAFPLLQMILGFRIFSRLFGGQENAEYLLSKGSVASLVGVGLIGASINILLNLTLIPRLGAFGTTIASGAGNLAANLLAAALVYKATQGTPQFEFWLKLTVICSASSILSHVLIDSVSVPGQIGQAGIYAVLLLVLLRVMKPLTQEDSAWLMQVSGRLNRFLQPFTRPAPSF